VNRVVRSILILLAVGSSFGLFLYQFGVNFWVTFTLVIVLQFAIWEFVRYILEARATMKAAEMEVQVLEELGKQTINIPCAACSKINMVPIRLDINNKFDCIECSKENGVYIDVESVQVTTPLQSTGSSETIKVRQW
jgi:hypothetical protein